LGEIMRLAQEGEEDSFELKLQAKNLAAIIKMIKSGTINRNTAKKVLAEVWNDDLDPEKYVADNNLAMVGDDNLVKETVVKVLDNNGKTVEEYKSGKEKVLSFLVGQCMKELKGKADPGIINKLLREELAKR
ncbi:MAG: Asp-tRNA(Asn)/Glu-tRNA(Gln) amidotransferase GatCAB subunit B, partial [Bacillota bacterium]|nr:Asp-tRNA(Asn)/Glu-tRNA(Gln) amidotransferase GatCAB subunit B [Bacillota bacterium]